MRCFALLATIYAAALGTTSALVDARARTTVGVYATGYNTATSASGGCNPAGCVPEYTRDNEVWANSRWSCQENDCCITYTFEEAQDIVKLRIYFNLGTSTTQTMNVYDNGAYLTDITSSGTTLGYETVYLYTDETEELMLCLDGQPNEWLNVMEVAIMVM